MLSSDPGSRRPRGRGLVSAIALAAALVGVGAQTGEAATWVKVKDGSIAIGTMWWGDVYEGKRYTVDGCQNDVWDAYGTAVFKVSQFQNKWLEIRIGAAETSLGDLEFNAVGQARCDLIQGPAFSVFFDQRYKFKVKDESHVTLTFKGPAHGVKFSLYRCTTTLC